MGPPLNQQPPAKMGSAEAVLLGRRGVVGAVNATSLATLVRSLRVGSPTNLRRGLQTYWLKCNEQGLEIRGPKYDEGFESDDTESTRSGGEPEERTSGDTSSGVSDLDEISENNSLIRIPPLRELYSIKDIVFCHGDPIFPKIVVWVVNTSKRPSPGFLEALVFECRNENSVRDLCMNYQEISRRYKLEHYNKRKEVNSTTSTLLSRNNEYEQKSSFTREMECVTGTSNYNRNCEVPVIGRRRERTLRQREPPSLLISPHKNESELHKIWTPPPQQQQQGPIIQDEPPKRPERRRYIRKKSSQNQPMSQDDNILKGQFVRVTVEPKTSPILLKPQFTWMYGVPTTTEMIPTHPVRSRRSCRSVSPTMSRRRPPPMPHRYGIDTHLTANRNMQGLTQKFSNLTTAIGGTLKHQKKYAHFEQQQYTTLKPVIKKTNKRFNNEYEPKKVTFSAYATVQVVD